MCIATSNLLVDLVSFLLILDSNLDWITSEIKFFMRKEKCIFCSPFLSFYESDLAFQKLKEIRT